MFTRHPICVEPAPTMQDSFDDSDLFAARTRDFIARLRLEIRLLDGRRRIGKNAKRRQTALEQRLKKLGETL